jgi:GntR family transcriptional regulator
VSEADAIDALAGGRPLYRRLQDRLQERIASGLYAVGTALPTEAALCAEFGVSRFTVREALRGLAELGLVGRRQGSGSQVLAAVPPVAFTQSMRSLDELYQYARDTRLDIILEAQGRPPRDMAEIAGIDAEADWLLVEAIRRDRAHGQPIAHSRIFAPAEFAPLMEDFRSTTGPFFRVIEQQAGRMVADVIQAIAAAPLSPVSAERLGAEPGAVGVRVTRRYLDRSGGTLIASINDHPAATFRYEMHLRREG